MSTVGAPGNSAPALVTAASAEPEPSNAIRSVAGISPNLGDPRTGASWARSGVRTAWRRATDSTILRHVQTSQKARTTVNSTVSGSDPRGRRLVRVAVVDDHAAIRIGLTSALASQPGLVCVGVGADGEELQPLLHRARPHVIVLDYHLPRVSGLELCRRIKSDVLAPAVLLYSAYADPALVAPAFVAGADGIVHKGSPARELFEAIHVVAGGGTQMPPLIPELLDAARGGLDVQDRRVLDLLVERTPRWEIAAALEVPIPVIDERTRRMLARLRSGVARRGSSSSEHVSRPERRQATIRVRARFVHTAAPPRSSACKPPAGAGVTSITRTRR